MLQLSHSIEVFTNSIDQYKVGEKALYENKYYEVGEVSNCNSLRFKYVVKLITV